jgi:hypothetical protein
MSGRAGFRYRARLNPDSLSDAGKTVYDIFFVVLPVAAQSCAVPLLARLE